MAKKFVKRESKKLIENAKIRQFRSIINEEVKEMFEDAVKRSKEIGTKLESVRKDLIKSGALTELEKGSGTNDRAALPERRIPLQTVSELTEIPVNELVLHFLNGHRISEGRQLVEYRLGCVFFYAEPKNDLS